MCPSCGKEFDCSKSNRCWCFEHDISVLALEKIESEYEGCLCPECLGKVECFYRGEGEKN